MIWLKKAFTWPLKQGALGGTLLFITTMAAADCNDVTMSSSGGLTGSQWQEFSASGKPLVKETGTLLVTRLDALAHCGGLQWHIHWAQAQGQRRYIGITNTQQAATSSTDIRDQSMQLDAQMPLDAHWSAALGVERRNTHRNIHSTEQASGYPERFSQWTGLAGLRYQHSASEDTTWAATAWVGRTLTGQVWLDLPNAEPTRLSLGAGHVVETSLTWAEKKTAESRWTWASTLSWRATRTASGPASALMKNGRWVGTALQPQTSTQSLGINATMKYAF